MFKDLQAKRTWFLVYTSQVNRWFLNPCPVALAFAEEAAKYPWAPRPKYPLCFSPSQRSYVGINVQLQACFNSSCQESPPLWLAQPLESSQEIQKLSDSYSWVRFLTLFRPRFSFSRRNRSPKDLRIPPTGWQESRDQKLVSSIRPTVTPASPGVAFLLHGTVQWDPGRERPWKPV